MGMNEKARKNHDRLFPNAALTLEKTDPELIEFFDNFAFDEVLQYGNLDEKTRLIIILGSTIASQALSEFKLMVEAALTVGVTAVQIKEVLYQSIAYVGFAKVVDFLLATNEIFEKKGIQLPLEGQSTTNPENRFDIGLAVQKSIFGNRIDQMHANAPENQKHIQVYLSANCFGDYYTRTGLDIKTRELLTFAMLISLGGCESQVKGHVAGNANVGNNKETLLSAVTQLLPYIGYPRSLNAISCINEILPD